jgi:hypothetical protein
MKFNLLNQIERLIFYGLSFKDELDFVPYSLAPQAVFA